MKAGSVIRAPTKRFTGAPCGAQIPRHKGEVGGRTSVESLNESRREHRLFESGSTEHTGFRARKCRDQQLASTGTRAESTTGWAAGEGSPPCVRLSAFGESRIRWRSDYEVRQSADKAGSTYLRRVTPSWPATGLRERVDSQPMVLAASTGSATPVM